MNKILALTCLALMSVTNLFSLENVLVVKSTSVAISVTMTPTLILSTGTNVPLRGGSGPTVTLTSSTLNVLPGFFMPDRTSVEILNQSTAPVWIGYNVNMTTFPSANLGRRIMESSGAVKLDGAVREIWISAGDIIPRREIVIIQHGGAK